MTAVRLHSARFISISEKSPNPNAPGAPLRESAAPNRNAKLLTMHCKLGHLIRNPTTFALLASLPAGACGLHFPWGDDGTAATCASRTGVSFDAATPGFDAGPDAAADSATRVWTGTLNYFDTQPSHLTTSFELRMNWSGEPVTVLNGPCIEGDQGQSSRPPYRIPIMAQFTTGVHQRGRIRKELETRHGIIKPVCQG